MIVGSGKTSRAASASLESKQESIGKTVDQSFFFHYFFV